MQERFDAIVVGAGQGGTPWFKVMAAHGWTVALVEGRMLGGVCTNEGCTPTKTMVASAKVANLARRADEFGIHVPEVKANLSRISERALGLAAHGRQQIEHALHDLSHAEIIYGEASFSLEQPEDNLHALDVRLRDGAGVRRITAPKIFLDTGCRPSTPQLPGLCETPCLDSRTILHLQDLPEHLLVLGGGYIAVEFAQMFRRFGAKVTIVEREGHLLSDEDDDITSCFADILREDGINLQLDAMVTAVSGEPGRVCLELDANGQKRSVEGTHLLVATGRVPNTEALHVERVDVVLDESGYVRVNDRLETNVPGIWALGDVTHGPPYSHASYDDFRILRANLLEGASRSTKGRLVPYCVFTDPELGRVGLSEKQAREAGLEFDVVVAPMHKTARAQEESETRGLTKALIDRKSDRLLGAAVLSLHGGEVVTELQLAMLGGLTATQLRETIFIHPVLAEGFHVLFGKRQ